MLAGGQSRRMGRDKALLRLQPDGPRLIEMVTAAVRPLVEQVVVSTNRPAEFAWLGYPCLRDQWPDAGPLAGLEAGLSFSQAASNLVLACDMPFVVPALLEHLLQSATGQWATVPLNQTGQPEPLCAVYSPACLPLVRQCLAAGTFKLSHWLAQVEAAGPVRYLSAAELGRYDPALRSFSNMNSPEDL